MTTSAPRPPLTDADISRIVEMAWEDRTPFEAIEVQFGLNESAVVALMRTHMKASSFRMWRTRMKGRVTKHAALRPAEMNSSNRQQAKHRIPQR
ncbi:MAG: TIGR03643 family protein [Polaromonas sp.]